jgi:hypothetical protein
MSIKMEKTILNYFSCNRPPSVLRITSMSSPVKMTDREKITAIVVATAESFTERDRSLTIHDSGIKIMFTTSGEIKSVIRNGQSFTGEEE